MTTEAPDDRSAPHVCRWQSAELPPNLKWSYVTRNISAFAVTGIEILPHRRPRAGDVICAKVVCMGQQSRSQTRDGRRSLLYTGDKLMDATRSHLPA